MKLLKSNLLFSIDDIQDSGDNGMNEGGNPQAEPWAALEELNFLMPF